MFNSIKKYFKKAKEEAGKEYIISPSGREMITPSQLNGDEPRRRPSAWVGVDLDGTLAHWDSSSSLDDVGRPVLPMMAMVHKMLKNGFRVKIFTARAQDPEQLPIIRAWMKENGLPELEITNVKDYYMQRLYDDRSVQVEKNTGRLIQDK